MSIPDLASNLETALINLFDSLEANPTQSLEQKIFNLDPKKKKIRLGKFIREVVQSLKLKDYHLAISLIYLDLYLIHFPITSNNIYYLFYVAIVICHKFYEDYTFYEDELANLLDLTEKELSSMQKIFLKTIDYKLLVNKEDYQEYLEALL